MGRNFKSLVCRSKGLDITETEKWSENKQTENANLQTEKENNFLSFFLKTHIQIFEKNSTM